MNDPHPSGISQSNTGSMSGGMQAVIGDNNVQTMHTGQSNEEDSMTTKEISSLLGELYQMIDNAGLPEEVKSEAFVYLSAAQKALDKAEPNKERIKVNVEGVAETLQGATQTIEAAKSFWSQAKPIFIKITKWLGAIAAGSILASL